MKKTIGILILLILAVAAMMMTVPAGAHVSVIVHDDAVKPKDECLEVINGADGDAGPWEGVGGYVKHGAPNYNIWLYGDNDAWVEVESTIKCSVIYIQYHQSDDNDGLTYIYVDGELVSSDIDTYNKGNWYVEIRFLPTTTHTVKVSAEGPSPDDNDVWYFCFCMPVGGFSVPVDKLALLAPYIALAAALVAVTIGAAYSKKRWLVPKL